MVFLFLLLTLGTLFLILDYRKLTLWTYTLSLALLVIAFIPHTIRHIPISL